MSFRKRINAHDAWAAFRKEKSESFEPFAAADLNCIDQKNFEEYLVEGINDQFLTPISELSDEQFLKLEEMVKSWESFDFGFDAFNSERIKRFYRYG